MALLAAYMTGKSAGQSLGAYLSDVIFAGNKGSRMEPKEADIAGFEAFMEKYRKGLDIEKAAVDIL